MQLKYTYQYVSIFVEKSKELLQTPHTTFKTPEKVVDNYNTGTI